MKTWISRFRQLSFAEKFSYMLLLLLILCCIPILQMGFYSHPVGDDYTYGMNAHLAWEETQSLFAVLAGAARTSREFWHSYQGPFASAFFMALQPAVISERLYAFTPFLMLFMMILSTCTFVHVLLVRYADVRPVYSRITTLILLLLGTQLLAAPSEAFYWYCGAVHYIFMHSCMLLLFSCLLLAFREERKSVRSLYLLLTLPLAVCCGGANFVTALITVILFVCLILLLLLLHEKRACLLTMPAFGFNLLAFLLNVTAPGNSVREADQLTSLSPFPAVYYAFRHALSYMGEWMNLYLIAALLILIPVIWIAVGNLKLRLRLPGLFTLFSFCLISSMFAPATYALGPALLYERMLNIIMQTYYLLLVLNLFYWIGWFRQRLAELSPETQTQLSRTLETLFHRYGRGILLSLGTFLIFAVLCAPKTTLTSKSAVHDIRKGYARAYHEETLHRIALLSAQGVDEVWVPNYTVRPALLDLEDINEDPQHWRNMALARWYGKKIVHLSVIY